MGRKIAEPVFIGQKVIRYQPKNAPQPSRKHIWEMFDRIAHRYDLLNRLLSFGLDVAWRKRMVSYLNGQSFQHVLDIATGTGDVLISLCRNSTKVTSAVGIDLAEKMLAIGRQKIDRLGLQESITLRIGDATRIPFPDNCFDAVTIAFGIRNVISVPLTLREMFRVLKPGGRVIILEFTLPERKWIRWIYLFYSRHVLPQIGSLISGDRYAYRYLNQTVETFPYGEAFCHFLEGAGFREVRFTALTLGVAAIYCGQKPL